MPSTTSPAPAPVPTHADDRSTHLHRQLVGWSGLLLAPLLWLLAGLRPVPTTPTWSTLDSISCYYHSGGVAAFVGIICALSGFLLTYRGYGNTRQWLDLIAAWVASLAALGVVLLPCTPTNGFAPPAWWKPWMGTGHNLCATVLFCSFAFFSLYLFTRGASTDPGSKRRRRIYTGCGAVIVIALGWAWNEGHHDRSIFLPETVALVAFAISWLVKGRVGQTLKVAARHVREQPRRYVKRLLTGA